MIRIFWLGLLCLYLPNVATAEVVKGIYGVPSIGEKDPLTYVGEMQEAGVNGVFVKPEPETVRWFKEKGFKVFVSVDAYGGSKAWKRFPDSRPVLADGSLLGEDRKYGCHGGACPSHEGWQQERLGYMKKLLEEFSGGDLRVDGIWLDYIRYPGRWSVLQPTIPDTCYCKRCLEKFSRDNGIQVPREGSTEEAANWIRKNCPHEWMKWKKGLIESFVRDVRKVLDRQPEEARPILGIFLVPWTKGERGNAVCYEFSQDGFELARYADVISPMVYHKKVGQPASWVGYMTRYYEETVPCEVWPIVQAMDCSFAEFTEAMRYAGEGGAQRVLGYPFGAVDKGGLWEGFRGFERLPNLLRRAGGKKVNGYSLLVNGEKKRGAEADLLITNQPITNNSSELIELCPGYGECGEWVVPLPECELGVEYVFRGDLFRKGWQNRVYPSVSIWGEEFLVNTHLKAKVFQPVRVNVVCPDEISDPYFRFINRNRNTTFWLTRPSLKRDYRFKPESGISREKWFFPGRFFPIGVYGADVKNLEQIKRLAINTVIIGGNGDKLKKKVEKCHKVGLRYVISVPHDPDKLPVFLNDISEYVRPYDLAFYVNDEPGIWSFPVNKADDINRLIKERFPGAATCMAVVRPQVCKEYENGADFFMLDQYPVPFMPMTWLSDCMEDCARGIVSTPQRNRLRISQGRDYADEKQSLAQSRQGAKRAVVRITNQQITNNFARGRLASVIQAFGGERYAEVGWPRLPTWQEMDCLAFLSVVHGSRGIFFYTFSWIGKTEEGRERLGRVVGRLNRVYPWLVVENSGEKVEVEMVSANRFDPKGRAAVHCCLKRKGKEMLLIAVNTIGTGVEAELGFNGEKVNGYSLMVNRDQNRGEGQGSRITNQQIAKNSVKRTAREVFSGEDYVIRDGRLRVKFGPYETKAFLSTDYADYTD